MNRSAIILKLTERLPNYLPKDIDFASRIVFETMIEALRESKRIEIRGFGSLFTVNRLARIGRNPKTGETVKVAPRRVVRFKPGKQLRLNLIKNSEKHPS